MYGGDAVEGAGGKRMLEHRPIELKKFHLRERDQCPNRGHCCWSRVGKQSKADRLHFPFIAKSYRSRGSWCGDVQTSQESGTISYGSEASTRWWYG